MSSSFGLKKYELQLNTPTNSGVNNLPVLSFQTKQVILRMMANQLG